MATATQQDENALAVPDWQQLGEGASKSEKYLAKRLQAVAADHRSVAWQTFVIGCGVGLSAWLLLGVLAEHWLVEGGLPAWARFVWLFVSVAGLVAAGMIWLLPLLRYRINLVYAARTIEQGQPELHNDLVNTVLLRRHPERWPEPVVHSLRRRTARGLARRPDDIVADRSQLLVLTYLFAGLVAIACLYQLFSPKNLLVSAARLAAPWARIAAPSRVRIEQPSFEWRMPGRDGIAGEVDRHPLVVQGGDVTLHRGRQLVITATMWGRRRGEQPHVRVVPIREDGSLDVASAWMASMVRRGGGASPGSEHAADDADAGRRETYEAVLPGSGRGMDRSVICTVEAGDGTTDPVRVIVVDVPSLLVRLVRYDFPDYTRRPPETVEWQGDLRALEGTRVSLTAEASLPLEKAWIDFGCDGKRDWDFSIAAADLATARAAFPMRLNDDRTGPWADSYQLQLLPKGREAEEIVSDQVRYRIDVVADMPPEVRIVKPVDEKLRVPPDAPVPIQLNARDPDFSVARIGLEYRVNGEGMQAIDWRDEQERAGPFSTILTITPSAIAAGPGTRISYRAVVEDNREPKANRSVSHRDDEPWPELVIDPSAAPQPMPPPSGQQPGGPSAENGSADDGEQNRVGDGGQDGRQNNPAEGQQPGDRRGPQDGQQGGEDGGQPASEAGEQQNPQQPQAGQDGQGASGGQSGEQGAGSEGESGDGSDNAAGGRGDEAASQPDAGEGGGNQSGGSQESGDQGAGERGEGPQGSGRQGRDRGPGQEHEGEQEAGSRNGEQSSAEQQGQQRDAGGPGEGERGDGQAGQERSVASDGTDDGKAMERILEHRRDSQQGEGRQGEGRQGEGQQGEGQQGEGRQGEGQQGEGQQGEGQQGEGQQGEGQQGEGQQGEGQQGEGQQGEGQQGEGQQGEGQQGEGQQGEGQQGEGQQGEGQQGEGQQGEGQQGEGQQGEGQQGEGRQGEGQQGEGQQGEGQQGGPSRTDAAGEGRPAGGLPESGDARGMAGQGSWSTGEGDREGEVETPPSGEMEWGDANLEHARNAADLAIEHLRDSLARGDGDLLERLGWTEEQARAFLNRWDAMQRLQRSNDPGDRVEFDRAVRSLGLRPDGVRSNRRATREQRDGEAEGTRSRPPSEYLERVRAYTRGLSAE